MLEAASLPQPQHVGVTVLTPPLVMKAGFAVARVKRRSSVFQKVATVSVENVQIVSTSLY